jgi:tRNA(fMet)-specific endonuclease VapC
LTVLKGDTLSFGYEHPCLSYAGDCPRLNQRIEGITSNDRLGFSVIRQAELYYGWARHGRPEGLGQLIGAFLARVEVLSWTQSAALNYGNLRADCEAQGIYLGAADMLIAAHAVAAKAVLISRDKAFSHLKNYLTFEDWA